jgi:hypothetical protein
MKLPKYEPESTLIDTMKPYKKYIQSCRNKNKINYFQWLINNPSIQLKRGKQLKPELSQNGTPAFQHIYQATYQVYISFHPVH